MSLVNAHRYSRYNNAFSNFHAIKLEDLPELFDVLNGNGFINLFQNLFAKASDCVSSLRIYPIKFEKLIKDDAIYAPYLTMGGKQWEVHNYNFSGLNQVDDTYTFTVATYDYPEATSWLDCEPFTTVQMYLPFMDFIDLPVNEILGSKITVEYAIDYSTGIATAFIKSKPTSGVAKVIAIKNGKIGIDISWGATNNTENVKNIISTILSSTVSLTTLALSPVTSSTVALAKVVTAGAMLGKTALTVGNSLQTRFTRGGNSSGWPTLLSPTTPYLIIKKPKLVPVDLNDYAHTYGLPLYESRTLSQLSGFTVVDEIHLTGFTEALDEEITEIENLLKTGVHL